MTCTLVQVGSSRWSVDIGARQDAALMLSSVHLTGGDQRRRTLEDQLAMRSYFAENDLISVRPSGDACITGACLNSSWGVETLCRLKSILY